MIRFLMTIITTVGIMIGSLVVGNEMSILTPK